MDVDFTLSISFATSGKLSLQCFSCQNLSQDLMMRAILENSRDISETLQTKIISSHRHATSALMK